MIEKHIPMQRSDANHAFMPLNMRTAIREWYLLRYPTDAVGQEIAPSLTFQDLFDAMDARQNVYDVLGVGDSLIRERVFEALAKIMGTDYDYIYDQWLRSN